MPTAKLRPGVGATGSILTRYIKPDQVLLEDDKTHRSEVVLHSRFANKNGQVYFRFHYPGDDGNGELLTGSSRFVKITKEGDEADLFVGDPPVEQTMEEEKKKNWGTSKARAITSVVSGS